MLLEGLVGMRLVEASQDAEGSARYRNTRAANRYLVRNKPDYLGDLSTTLTTTGGVWSLWADFVGSVAQPSRERNAQGPPPDFDNDAYKLGITNAIVPLTRRAAEITVDRLKSEGREIRRILDVGGGSGIFAEIALEGFPLATAVQVDYPRINQQARHRLAESAVAGRFQTLDGQFPAVDLAPGSFDLIIYSGYSHQLGDAQNRMQVGACADLLSNGGHLVFHDYLSRPDAPQDPSRITNLNWLLVGFGQTWPLATVIDWLEDSGLIYSWSTETGLWMTLAAATKGSG